MIYSCYTYSIQSRYQLIFRSFTFVKLSIYPIPLINSTLVINCFWYSDMACAFSNRAWVSVILETITCDLLTNHISGKFRLLVWFRITEPIIQKLRPYMFWHIWICFGSHDIQSYCSITHLRSGCGSSRCSGTKDVLVHLILT